MARQTPEPLRRVYPNEAWACHTCGRRLLKDELYVVGQDKGIRCIECVFPEALEALERLADEMQSASSAGVSVDSKWLDKRIAVARDAVAKAKAE